MILIFTSQKLSLLKIESVLKMLIFPRNDKLKDGTPIVIRLIRPDDKEGLKSAFNELSPHSNFCRFLTPVASLSKAQLKYLTETDNKNHLAICVHNLDFTGIAVARYIKIKDEPNTAEIAITILDEYHNKGLGTKLLQFLIEEATENGIKKFIGFVLEENRAMIKILEKFGAKLIRDEKDVLKAEMNLTPNFSKSLNF